MSKLPFPIFFFPAPLFSFPLLFPLLSFLSIHGFTLTSSSIHWFASTCVGGESPSASPPPRLHQRLLPSSVASPRMFYPAPPPPGTASPLPRAAAARPSPPPHHASGCLRWAFPSPSPRPSEAIGLAPACVQGRQPLRGAVWSRAEPCFCGSVKTNEQGRP
jgi:hypothetical protein